MIIYLPDYEARGLVVAGIVARSGKNARRSGRDYHSIVGEYTRWNSYGEEGTEKNIDFFLTLQKGMEA